MKLAETDRHCVVFIFVRMQHEREIRDALEKRQAELCRIGYNYMKNVTNKWKLEKIVWVMEKSWNFYFSQNCFN